MRKTNPMKSRAKGETAHKAETGSKAGVKTVSARLRVRYSETDQMGVAYYANFFVWFEVGRAEYMRTLGYEYARLEKEGFYLPVTEAFCRYVAPALYDSDLRIETSVGELTPVRIQFSYSITDSGDGKLIATGCTKHAVLDKAKKPMRMPDAVRRLLTE